MSSVAQPVYETDRPQNQGRVLLAETFEVRYYEPDKILIRDEQRRARAQRKKIGGISLGGASVLAVSLALYTLFFTPLDRMLRRAYRGDLVTPIGASAYDLYGDVRAHGLDAKTTNRVHREILPKLIARGNEIVQKRTEGDVKRVQVQEAIRLYEWACDLSPNDSSLTARLHYGKGLMALFDNDNSTALRELDEAANLDSSWALAANDVGRAYVRLRMYDKAAESYRKAAQIDPGWVFPRLNLAGIYLAQKQWSKAEQGYLEVTELDPDYATPWYLLGQVYEGQGKTAKAADAYERAVARAVKRPSSVFKADALQRRIYKLRKAR